jgi:hypothetical protein
MGKIILANIGSIQNKRKALRNKERANNKSKAILLLNSLFSLAYYKITCKNRIKLTPI